MFVLQLFLSLRKLVAGASRLACCQALLLRLVNMTVAVLEV
jgi:hypothetical protein